MNSFLPERADTGRGGWRVIVRPEEGAHDESISPYTQATRAA